MSNCYTGFSFVVCNEPTAEEKEWWGKQVLDAKVLINDQTIIICDDENGDIEVTADLCQEFLQAFPRHKYIAFEWSNWSDRGIVDGFSGGGVFITAEDQEWIYPSSILTELVDKVNKG